MKSLSNTQTNNGMSVLIRSIVGGVLLGMACIISSQYPHPEIIFPIGLICIICTDNLLFTGCVGHYKLSDYRLLIVLAGNILGIFVCVLYAREYIDINLIVKQINFKYSEPLLRYFLSTVFCGILMCAATSLNRENNMMVAIICVAGFVIGKFEHSIANVYYLFMNSVSAKGIALIAIAVVGNLLGAKLLYVSHELTFKKGKKPLELYKDNKK